MSSLWTPEGEHRVPLSDAPESPAAPPEPGDERHDRRELPPDAEAQISELERQLAAAPASEVIANHCYGIFQLAALHLSQDPPRLEEAKLAIDALAAVVEGLGERLGAAAPTLRDGLAQIRLAFVQISGGADPGAAGSAS